MSAIPKDPDMYKKIKKKADEIYERHSAYKSGYIVKEYKKAYKKKYGNGNPYKKKGDRLLKRWFDEEWKNQRGEVGYKYKSDVYRPTKRISKGTPTTFSELTPDQIKRARKEKKTKGRVKRFDKK
jgi:hypothetical protein